MQFKETLTNLLHADVNIIQTITHEVIIVESMVNEASNSMEPGREWYKWSLYKQLRKWNKEENGYKLEDANIVDIEGILTWYIEKGENSILIIEGMSKNIFDCPFNCSIMREIMYKNFDDRALILVEAEPYIPYAFEKHIYSYHVDLPSNDDLSVILNLTHNRYQVENKNSEELNDAVLSAASGLTTIEAKRAFSKAIVSNGQVSNDEIDIVTSEKETIIKNSGMLEFYPHKESFEDVGGLDVIKTWINKRKKAFDSKAKEIGLEAPKGAMFLGIPGTGKSMCAKAIGNALQQPVIKFDLGKVFGSLVGESEKNIRKALKYAEAIAPCVLWIDEIEKGISGADGSSRDGGTSVRVLGTLLNWMQEKEKPVFVVATANNIAALPPELLRKGRFDEIFFVDLPHIKDREEIVKIHLSKLKNVKISNKDTLEIVNACKYFSGAEIANAIKDAMYEAYYDNKELNAKYIINSMKKSTPLYETMKETIEGMRSWGYNRATPATSDTWDNVDNTNIPMLKTEFSGNPFLKNKENRKK